MTEEHYEVFRRAIKEYGAEAQLRIAIEEMSELIKEVCKHLLGEDNHDSMAEEMAGDENRNHVGVVTNDDMEKAYSIIWERVLALKGGDKV